MVIFVFAGQGFGMSYGKLTGHTFWSSGCIFVSCIYIVRGGFSILYWIAQLLGVVVAYLLVKVSIDGKEITAFSFSYGVTPWTVVVFEIVMTFGLVYTVYVTAVDPKKGDIEKLN
ncbi:unnamed protein product [Brassica oleracea var. botrytis]|uniref:Uncharacterized protein n=2 Tax=Brassica TaxID=3705 RepID=A0A3P6DPD6_BRAOL|nr:hypothetical protein HID58_049988 [Brassica napus]KAH0898380.1 hypothetical protein HID58_047948 [Brassica napus]CAF1915906.1 unnamed protein product [Brassica napus]VDD23985.1 unnamed protein product [Brassica oleracea]